MTAMITRDMAGTIWIYIMYVLSLIPCKTSIMKPIPQIEDKQLCWGQLQWRGWAKIWSQAYPFQSLLFSHHPLLPSLLPEVHRSNGSRGQGEWGKDIMLTAFHIHYKQWRFDVVRSVRRGYYDFVDSKNETFLHMCAYDSSPLKKNSFNPKWRITTHAHSLKTIRDDWWPHAEMVMFPLLSISLYVKSLRGEKW